MKAGRVVIGKKQRIGSTGWLTANNHQPENQNRNDCFGDGWGDDERDLPKQSGVKTLFTIQTHFHIQRGSFNVGLSKSFDI